MHHVSGTLKDNHMAYVNKKINKHMAYGSSKTSLTKDEVAQCDVALKDYKDLIDEKFSRWICKRFYELGAEKFHQYAKEARSGKNPQKLFSYLLKKDSN